MSLFISYEVAIIFFGVDMPLINQHIIKLIAIFLSILLTGCGGGSGDSSSASSNYAISGAINGAAISGVTINLAGAATRVISTDSSGSYSLTGLANGYYTITPSMVGYTFNPTNTAVNVSGANVSGTNFTATANPAPTHTLSGTVTGAAISNVLVTLSGAATATTLTSASGNYSFTGLANGNYTATPLLAGYSFSQTSNSATINGANATVGNFVATAIPTPTYSITGAVSGAVLSGVHINFTGAATVTGITDTSGNFSLLGPLNGNYTVTPSLAGYTFTPANVAVTVSGANVSGVSFIATANSAPTYSLSGTITGSVLQNVLVTLSGAGSATTLTNASGNYSFSGLTNGGYTATPSLAGYSFSPTSNVVTVNGANTTIANFVATTVPTPTYSISGTLSGAVISGATINLTGAATISTTTDASGNYNFTGLMNGNYTITPSMSGYTFNPTNTAASLSGASITSTNFSATANAAPTYTLSGTVTGAASSSVLITLSGAVNATTLTNASGNYSFTGITNGQYTITPSLGGYSFSPLSVTTSGSSVQNFTSVAGQAYSVSGYVHGASYTSGLSGVTITLTGTTTATSTTSSDGHYYISGLPKGSYTVTPSLAGYAFNPSSSIVSDVYPYYGDTAEFQGAAASAATYTLSGSISGVVLSGIEIELGGSGNASTLTNASGNYSFTNLANGSYTVTPIPKGYPSTPPASYSASINGANATIGNLNVPGPFFLIRGKAAPFGTVMLTGSAITTTSADSSGNFSFNNLLSGSYTVTPKVRTNDAPRVYVPSQKIITISDSENFSTGYLIKDAGTFTLSP